MSLLQGLAVFVCFYIMSCQIAMLVLLIAQQCERGFGWREEPREYGSFRVAALTGLREGWHIVSHAAVWPYFLWKRVR